MSRKPWESPKWPEKVPHEIAGYEKPLFSLLDDTAREFPNATYTIFADVGRTYAQVKDTVDRIANFLASRGIQKGDRVAIFLPNLPHYPEIFFGILKAGGVCVTCNPLYKASELNYQLKDSGSRVVFVMDHPQFYATAVEAIRDTDVETVVICNVKSYLPWLKGALGSLLGKIPKADHHEQGHILFDQAVKSARPEPPGFEVDPVKDIANILYTGGTTGVPKGACLSHANLVSNVMTAQEWTWVEPEPGEPKVQMARGGEHTFLGVLPWYHSFGLTLVMLWSCYIGSRVVCIPDPRAGDPPFTEVLKAVEKNKVTILTAVPTIYSAFVNHPLLSSFDLSSITGCGSGAAPLPVEVIKQFEEKTGAVIFEGYGMTETSPVITLNPTNREQRKVGSVGLPFPGTDIKIVDLDTGIQELPDGEDGEIAASGPQVMLGYWNKPEANKEVFREIEGKRYLLTGDIGHFDEEGFLVITDRKKDLILVGGFNAYPKEIEEVLYMHPKVALAAVVGVPDEKSGEAVKAFVQLKPGQEATEQEILDFCKDKMAGYKRPKAIEFRDELPTSVVGKVLRRVLRDEEREKHQK
ncbi:MAG: long-chain fatty acid--CoA ligase [Deltaproteobacteria bacterium]|nr:MAG: long-chain-fatty-acid--CoA ligase [Desulfobacteraceae bacterium 4484_190.3]RLB19242.1 MAG: long-chain fatty acid--CoA ligase [Deltaproteobacteria bacterium]